MVVSSGMLLTHKSILLLQQQSAGMGTHTNTHTHTHTHTHQVQLWPAYCAAEFWVFYTRNPSNDVDAVVNLRIKCNASLNMNSWTPTPEICFLDVLFKSLDITPSFSSVSHLECRYKSLNYHTPSDLNTLRTGSFKLFKRPFPGFLTILTL